MKEIIIDDYKDQLLILSSLGITINFEKDKLARFVSFSNEDISDTYTVGNRDDDLEMVKSIKSKIVSLEKLYKKFDS